MLWALPPGVTLSWRQWEPEEVVVYNRASGGTHMLDAFSAAALQLLAEQPCAISTLTHQLAAQSGAEQPAVRTRLDEVLNTLHTLGLADPIPPCDLVS